MGVRDWMLLLLGAGGLTACHLIDQTSFGGAPRSPAEPELVAGFAADRKGPLLIVRPDDGTDHGAALREALAAAEARSPDVRFHLEAATPIAGDPDAQAAAMSAAQITARDLLNDMIAAGVSPERITVSAHADAHVVQPELLLFGS